MPPKPFTGLQEATGELIEKLTTATTNGNQQKSLSAQSRADAKVDLDNFDPASAVGFTSAPFDFEYTFKVICSALDFPTSGLQYYMIVIHSCMTVITCVFF